MPNTDDDKLTWSALVGEPDADRLIPAATALVWAIRTGDPDDVDEALSDVVRASGGGVRALAVVLAAMVPDDESPRELMAWRLDPAGYLRLREHGYCRHTATATMLARVSGGHA